MEQKKDLTRGEQLRRDLAYEPKNGYDRLGAEELAEMEAYCKGYKDFLNRCKTERECVSAAVELAQAAGFRPYERGMALRAGDRIYTVNRRRGMVLAVMGRKGLEEGVRMGAAHIDAPRLDLKQNPLYESDGLGFLKTRYYGGIRKYQWVTIPLELRGVVALKDGQVLTVAIGNRPEDPLVTIDDLLPHLGAEQSNKPLGDAIPGESLNLLVGSRPLAEDEGSDRVKLTILECLYREYGIREEDFLSAELCAVPAFEARAIGFDRSLIGAYGHDDRVCAYAALQALFQLEQPEHTALCILADREEIGSYGVTGIKSGALDAFLLDLCRSQDADLHTLYGKSLCISADVTAAYDPNFADVYEKRNSAFVNHGVSFSRYGGGRGKSGASDASAELAAWIRRTLDGAGVVWQMAELGKVDAGGGGTVAVDLAQRNIDTIDAGVPVLSMHAPYETVGKLDCYMTCRAMQAVFEAE